MAKKIIVLEKSPESGLFRAALWADVPVGRQIHYAKPGAVSAWVGASLAENTAIANGQIAERVITLAVSDGATNAQIRTALERGWTDYQAYITEFNPWFRYGSFYEGTTWTAGGAT